MRSLLRLSLLFFLCVSCLGQDSIDDALKRYNSGSVPYITGDSLYNSTSFVVLDSRTAVEFEVSHIKDAIWIGYKDFELQKVLTEIPDKDTEIAIYCSIGVRSEKIGERLQEAGYKNVRNLYGGIFQWKDKGYPVYNPEGAETEKVHAYSKQWGKLLTKAEKVYSP